VTTNYLTRRSQKKAKGETIKALEKKSQGKMKRCSVLRKRSLMNKGPKSTSKSSVFG